MKNATNNTKGNAMKNANTFAVAIFSADTTRRVLRSRPTMTYDNGALYVTAADLITCKRLSLAASFSSYEAADDVVRAIHRKPEMMKHNDILFADVIRV
jgi:hypothetical protein